MEANAQLAEAAAGSQHQQDRLLERYLDLAIEAEEWVTLNEPTMDLCRALRSWFLGLNLDRLSEDVDLLVGLHRRTLSPLLKEKVREAIEGTMKVARYYNRSPGADRAARRAAAFLERE